MVRVAMSASCWSCRREKLVLLLTSRNSGALVRLIAGDLGGHHGPGATYTPITFDAPAMNPMYIDKPMQGAGLMQAIARVNRTFRDKPGGLIVDYLGIAPNLRKALAEYSPTDRDQAGVPIEQMVAVMLEKHTSSAASSMDSHGHRTPGYRPRSAWPSCGTSWTSSSPTRTARPATSIKSLPSSRPSPCAAPETRRW